MSVIYNCEPGVCGTCACPAHELPHNHVGDDVVVPLGPREVSASRRRLPDERPSVTHRFRVGGVKGYLTVGLRADGAPGEVFIVVDHRPVGAEDVSVSVRGFVDAVAVQTSLLLQYGVPIDVAVGKLIGMNFVPRGFTGNSEIPRASSILDYCGRWLLRRFVPEVYAARFGEVAPAPGELT